MQEATNRISMLAGASGMVGSLLLRVLLSNTAYTRVIAVSRRPLSVTHPRLANRVVRFARLAQHCGARQFVGVSSIGADPQSKNQYLRVKGETEAALIALRFPA